MKIAQKRKDEQHKCNKYTQEGKRFNRTKCRLINRFYRIKGRIINNRKSKNIPKVEWICHRTFSQCERETYNAWKYGRPEILKSKLRSVLKKMNRNKVAGLDVIVTEMLTVLDDFGTDKITGIINELYNYANILEQWERKYWKI